MCIWIEIESFMHRAISHNLKIIQNSLYLLSLIETARPMAVVIRDPGTAFALDRTSTCSC